MSNEQELNPLAGWTQEQIKSALKSNTKTTLLRQLVGWIQIAEQLKSQLNELHRAEHSKAPKDNAYDDTETGTSVED